MCLERCKPTGSSVTWFGPLRLRSVGPSAGSMSDKKKNAPMPASSAGLLTFFNEATNGVKIRPEIILIGSIVLIATSIVINALFR